MNEDRIAEFQKLWTEASNAVIYSAMLMQNERSILPDGEQDKLIRQEVLDKLIRQEVLDKRFASAGVRHPARVWLERVREDDSESADRILEILQHLKARAGVDFAHYAKLAAAGVAAGTVAVAVASTRGKLRKIIPLAGGVSALGVGVKGLMDLIGDKNNTISQLSASLEECGRRIREILERSHESEPQEVPIS
jgi:hypothetical protein